MIWRVQRDNEEFVYYGVCGVSDHPGGRTGEKMLIFDVVLLN